MEDRIKPIVILPSQKKFIAWTIMLVFFTITIFKSFYGFDWSDETYYSALSYRFIIGDSMFVNSWDIHQTSSILTIPLMKIFLLFSNGSTDGILLFLRLVYVTVHFLISVYVYHVLNKKYNFVIALASALMLIIFVPGGVGTFSYNTYVILFSILSLFLMFEALENQRWHRIKIFISGFMFALCVQSYPYAFLLMPVYIFYFVYDWEKAKSEWKNKGTYLTWGIGIICAFIGFIIFVCLNSSLSNLFGNLNHLLSDPEHLSNGFLAEFVEYLKYYKGIFGFAIYAIIGVTLLTLANSFMRESKLKQSFRILLFALICVLIIWCIIIVLFLSPHNSARVSLLAIPISLLGPAIFCINDRKFDKVVCLFFAGVLLSLAVNFGSNNELNHSGYPLILSSIAVIVYTGKIAFLLKKKITPILLTISVITYLFCIVEMTYVRVSNSYRDEFISHLSYRIQSGPAAGIKTTKESAEKYEEIIFAIQEYAPESGTVFFTKLLPFGYLCTELRPAFPSLWRTTLDRFSTYIELYPELEPQFIFVVDEEYGITNNNNKTEEWLSKQSHIEEYKQILLDCGTIYLRLDK